MNRKKALEVMKKNKEVLEMIRKDREMKEMTMIEGLRVKIKKEVGRHLERITVKVSASKKIEIVQRLKEPIMKYLMRELMEKGLSKDKFEALLTIEVEKAIEEVTEEIKRKYGDLGEEGNSVVRKTGRTHFILYLVFIISVILFCSLYYSVYISPSEISQSNE